MESIYSQLIQAEAGLKLIYSSIKSVSNIKCDMEDAESRYKYYNSNYMPGVWMLRIFIPIALIVALIFLIVPSKKISPTVEFLSILLGGAAVIFIFIGIVLLLIYGKGRKTASQDIERLKKSLDSATALMNNTVTENTAALEIAQKYMPEDCMYPKHARVFIGYFESGRASTVNEATALFEEYIHRYRMEQLAADRLEKTDELLNTVVRLRKQL